MPKPGVTISTPLIIGATGGSGTRVVARLARQANFNLGTHLNEADDALEFRSFHDEWINRFLVAEQRQAKLPNDEAEQMAQAFHEIVARHLSRADRTNAHWGWKAPRSIYLLPFLHAQFPDLKFIHVLRDGRDMAFSKNQNQLHKHGPAVLTRRERWFNSQPGQAILLWERVNLRAAEYGQSRLGENYLAVRFEDLCQAPVETTARLLRFLEADLDAVAIAGVEIAPPLSLGRWRKQPARLISKLERLAAVSLRKFCYINGGAKQLAPPRGQHL